MPKKATVTIGNYSSRHKGKAYRARIEEIKVKKAENHVSLRLVHLDADQAGRVHDMRIPSGFLPGGITAELVSAVGEEVTIGKVLTPEDWQGQSLRVTFTTNKQGQDEVEHFLPDIAEE